MLLCVAAARAGNQEALDRLFSWIYDELHRLARQQRYQWCGHHTLNTTALVHEAYLKLARDRNVSWKDRAHFFALAARVMRQVLVNEARKKKALRRGGGQVRVHPDAEALVAEDAMEELLALDDALGHLERRSERQCRVFESRFFLGLSVEETAAALDVSPSTVKRDWRQATTWLYRLLNEEGRKEQR
ncbi:sigma-70 family RNA polymerase sigma factor [Rhodocaloribacter litoris]|uniref:ECF-type sigma factor n=1 Tax=Rhodocaloribacter litoris TaxID=2558931 RepID=UPI00141F4E35|nr:ECF-type sigma factor [Rhodocaloribacter litoris]QXD16978.1 sigma-70 family RNA polymerase sigma factor [Rhodocaloribacter litoris]